MAGFTAALSAAAIGLQVYGMAKEAQSARETAAYNAQVYQQEAQATEGQKKITTQQYQRAKEKLIGSTIVGVAGQGRDLSGSALQVLNDNITQIEMDRAVDIYSLDIQKSQALSAATRAIRGGQVAARSSLIQAGTTLLTQGNEWYQKYGGFGKTK